jgi:hypothetical protein
MNRTVRFGGANRQFRRKKDMNKKLLDAIVANGDAYCLRHLSQFNARTLETNWWQAFDFFLSRACNQGRRDEMSKRVYESVYQVLSPLFAADQSGKNYEAQNDAKWQLVSADLNKRIGKGKVGKARDVEMVISALSYVGRLKERNIVGYSVAQIRGKKLRQHYLELQPRNGNTGITQVGPKIAAFYLRDIVSIFQLTDCVASEDAFCLQAVDTWVQKVAEKLEIVEKDADTETVQQAIVSVCEKNGISPLRFNQGAWFTGYHAFELVLDLLSK